MRHKIYNLNCRYAMLIATYLNIFTLHILFTLIVYSDSSAFFQSILNKSVSLLLLKNRDFSFIFKNDISPPTHLEPKSSLHKCRQDRGKSKEAGVGKCTAFLYYSCTFMIIYIKTISINYLKKIFYHTHIA